MNATQISFFNDFTTKTPTADDRMSMMRERIGESRSFDAYTEAEVLEYFLAFTGCNERAEVAFRLLEHFGSVKGVLEARPEMLTAVKGVGPKTASLIASLIPIIKMWNRIANETPDKICNTGEAESYCKSLLAGQRNESFYVIALNAQCQILGRRKVAEGTLSEVPAYPRIIVEAALNFNAHSILLTHNHPGGTCSPSLEDINSTVQIQKVLKAISILVLDHIIIAGDQTYSMIQHGDIDYRIR